MVYLNKVPTGPRIGLNRLAGEFVNLKSVIIIRLLQTLHKIVLQSFSTYIVCSLSFQEVNLPSLK